MGIGNKTLLILEKMVMLALQVDRKKAIQLIDAAIAGTSYKLKLNNGYIDIYKSNTKIEDIEELSTFILDICHNIVIANDFLENQKMA